MSRIIAVWGVVFWAIAASLAADWNSEDTVSLLDLNASSEDSLGISQKGADKSTAQLITTFDPAFPGLTADGYSIDYVNGVDGVYSVVDSLQDYMFTAQYSSSRIKRVVTVDLTNPVPSGGASGPLGRFTVNLHLDIKRQTMLDFWNMEVDSVLYGMMAGSFTDPVTGNNYLIRFGYDEWGASDIRVYRSSSIHWNVRTAPETGNWVRIFRTVPQKGKLPPTREDMGLFELPLSIDLTVF